MASLGLCAIHSVAINGHLGVLISLIQAGCCLLDVTQFGLAENTFVRHMMQLSTAQDSAKLQPISAFFFSIKYHLRISAALWQKHMKQHMQPASKQYLEGLPPLMLNMVSPHIAEILLAAVSPIDDHSVANSNSSMAVSDRWPCPLHVWSVPCVCVHIKHGDIIQVWLV